MKKKIKKYLLSKNKYEYSNLDQLLEMYLNDEIKYLLSNYEGVNIYPSIRKVKGKLEKTIQICFNYHNIFVTIDFFEDKYNLVIYPCGISNEDLEKLFLDYDYSNDFNLIAFLKEIEIKIKKHPELKDMSQKEKNIKLYKLISTISIIVSFLFMVIISMFVIITKNELQLNPWYLLFFILPLTIKLLCDIKISKIKNKE